MKRLTDQGRLPSQGFHLYYKFPFVLAFISRVLIGFYLQNSLFNNVLNERFSWDWRWSAFIS